MTRSVKVPPTSIPARSCGIGLSSASASRPRILARGSGCREHLARRGRAAAPGRSKAVRYLSSVDRRHHRWWRLRTRLSTDYPPIGDYGIIGNCRTAALVSRDGSIDWLCLPKFDSPSVLAALLDARQGGRCQVCPAGDYRVTRQYQPGTNVLETTFHTASGTCVLRDVMPVDDEAAKRRQLAPEHEVLREIEGLTGTVELAIRYEPRPDYA